jgi:hypothetical protein
MRPVSLILPLLLAGAVDIAAQQKPSPAKRPAAATPAAAAQPKVVLIPVEKCIDCTATVKKRLAVVAVNVDRMAAEFGKDAKAVAASLRDAVEAELAKSSALVLVNRTQFADVLAEQELAASGITPADLAPKMRAIIPAQLLLYVTATRLDLNATEQRNETTSAQSLIAQAEQIAQAAAGLDPNRIRIHQMDCSSARSRLNSCQRFQQQREQLRANGLPALTFGQGTDCSQQEYAVQECEASRQQAAERGRMEAMRMEEERRRMFEQAAELRRKAREEATKDVAITETKTADLSIVWRAIDTSTGLVVGSGTVSRDAAVTENRRVKQSDFGSDGRGSLVSTINSSSSSGRHDNLLNDVIGKVVGALSSDVETKTKGVPFKAKIVKVDASGIVINAGMEHGLSVGDTFGVRQKTEALTDPDTGQLLSAPGAVVGLIRISDVAEKTGIAQVIQAAGMLKRGDELEWVGVFK